MSEPQLLNGPATFRFFCYRVEHDLYGWVPHNRASLVATQAASALACCYGGATRVARSVLIRRAVADDFAQVELDAVLVGWAAAWEPGISACAPFLERHGIPDIAANLDLSPIDVFERTKLALEPTEAEVKEALAPWVAYWRTLP